MYLSLAYLIVVFFLINHHQRFLLLSLHRGPHPIANGWYLSCSCEQNIHNIDCCCLCLPAPLKKKEKKKATDQVFMSCKQTCYERAFSGHLALRECWITLPVSCSFRKRQGLTPGYQAAPLSYLHCGVQAPLGGFSPAGQLEASCPTLMACFIMQSRLFYFMTFMISHPLSFLIKWHNLKFLKS